MRFAGTLTVLIGAALLLGVVAFGQTEQRRPAAEDPPVFGAVRSPYEPPTLYVYVPHEPDYPGMTADSPYFTVRCDAADGRRLLNERVPWPTEDDDDHFHAAVPIATARAVDRCRLEGIASPLNARVTDGPVNGAHPPSLPSDPAVSLHALDF